jgi:hypothetical protein
VFVITVHVFIFIVFDSLDSGRLIAGVNPDVFMGLGASWTGDLGFQFHLFFVVVGHPF